MKILMVAPMVPRAEAQGAIPLVLDARVAGLRECGHSLSLIARTTTDPADHQALVDLAASGVDVHGIPQGMAGWARRRRLARSWLFGRVPFRSAWFWEAQMQARLDALLAREQFDLVLLEDNAAGLYQIRTPVRTILTDYEVRRPRRFDWHGLRSKGFRRWWLLRELDWQHWASYQRWVWRRFDCIQVFTQRDASIIGQLLPRANLCVHVNPFGIRLPARPIDPALEDSNRLLFVGNFTHPPNVDGLLWLAHEILPRVRTAFPGVKLEIVGFDPPAAIRALASDDVIVHGQVPEMRPYLERAAVLLAPLRTGGGQRMKVLYAMALGKAVVTTPRGAQGLSIGGHEPPLVTASDAGALAEATVALLKSPETRHDYGRRARLFVAEHFSPAKHALRQDLLVQRLSQDRGRG